MEYPWYYVKPFHGYDEGNLSWRAAHELEAATQSMCLGALDVKTHRAIAGPLNDWFAVYNMIQQ